MRYVSLSCVVLLQFVSLGVSLRMASQTFECKIDRAQIERFTKEQKLSGDRITLADTVCSGLKLVINKESASWTYAYRKRGYLDGGKRHPQRTMKLGDPVTMTPAEARLAAEQIKAQVRNGEDPASIARKEKAAKRAEEARRKSCLEWLARYNDTQMANGKTKHQRDEVRHVRFALDEMGMADAFPAELTSRHIRGLGEIHAERPATARHRFGALSRFLDYLLDEEVIPLNPATSVSRKRRPKPAAPRTRFFTPDELNQLWNANSLKPEYLRYLRFMISTPLRASEGAALRHDQVILDRDEIRFSNAETKNDEYFVMPLTSMSKNLLLERPAGDHSKVFQLSSIPDADMTAWSFFNKEVRAASGVQGFSMHHLRRTFATLMAEHSDVSEGLIDSLLNHKQSATRTGVMKHYQHSKQLEQRRDVMARWHELLAAWL